MSWGRRTAAMLLLVLAFAGVTLAGGAFADEPAGLPEISHQRADPEVVASVLQQAEVDQRLPAAGWRDYLMIRLRAAAERWLGGVGEGLVGLLAVSSFWGVLGWVLIAAGALALLVAWRRWRSGQRPSPAVPPPPEALPAAVREVVDPATLRAEIEALLARGEVSAALAVAWWWVARSLAGAAADPTWTSRELLAHAARPDLAPALRALDRFVYGPRPPAAGELAAWLGSLEGRLG